MNQLLRTTYGWLEHRLGLIKPIADAAAHPTPSSNASWWYVFGSAATVLLMLQVVTGILLALVYSPSANEAWNSLNFLNHNVGLGWYLRALHGWGSDFVIAIVLIHMVQVFLFGAFKFPRELTWIVGVLLLLLTLAMAFTGQVMRFDQDAYWGFGIGASILSLHDRTPLERQGALVLQNKQCRNCHQLDHLGGHRGPALDDIAACLTEDQIIR